MPTVELRQLVGKFAETRTGRVRSVGWNMDQVLLDGRQIANINRVPGAPVGLMPDVLLSVSERKAVEDAITAARGVKPAKIGGPITADYEILDDEDDADDTDVDEADSE